MAEKVYFITWHSYQYIQHKERLKNNKCSRFIFITKDRLIHCRHALNLIWGHISVVGMILANLQTFTQLNLGLLLLFCLDCAFIIICLCRLLICGKTRSAAYFTLSFHYEEINYDILRLRAWQKISPEFSMIM